MTARAATAAFGRATGSAWTPLAALGAVGAVAAGLVFIGPVVGLAIVGLLGVLLLIMLLFARYLGDLSSAFRVLKS